MGLIYDLFAITNCFMYISILYIPDIKADITVAGNRQEDITLMEPMRIREDSPRRGELTELAFTLVAKSAGFRNSLPNGMAAPLASLVRSMNCYYSNLIEGHNTHPIDIERAMDEDYDAEPEKRELQLEARAHVSVQRWIDDGGIAGQAVSREGICRIHHRFGELLPDALLWVEDPATGERIRIEPGKVRDSDVKVGRHVAIGSAAVPRFLDRFEEAYGGLGNAETVLSAAAAHHRLVWIHPFVDGNGRVARLMSHAMLRDAMDTGGLWSIARGLARNEQGYKAHLQACDSERRGDLDGRGNLSEEALADFTRFFLETCIDQVEFMSDLVQPDRLRDRILIWAEEEIRADRLFPRSTAVLKAILFQGELPRADAPTIVGTGARQARRIVSRLLEAEVIASDGPRAPLRIAFPARLAGRWMPGLFPETG